MILPENKNIVKMNGNIETTKFNIKTDDGKMFHILSNLYSNPLGAVVRELSTNCIDGHKIAGHENKPFDIILPNTFDLGNFITFRDYGPGMSHDTVVNIFTTFGQSTKNNSNLETGCLGLGSKSPLAITNSFTVTSVNNGIKTTYSVSKDEQQKPILANFGTVETKEDNGLSVTVPLTRNYQENILKEIKNQLKYFNVKPNVYKGDKLIKLDYDKYTDDDFKLLSNVIIRRMRNYYHNRDLHKIIQGEIGYEFNTQTFLDSFNIVDDTEIQFLESSELKISKDTFNIIEQFFEMDKIEIFMKMGSVTFAPSREELIYDKVTCQNIMTQILLCIHEVYDICDEILLNTKNSYQYDKLVGTNKPNEVIDLNDRLMNFLDTIGTFFIIKFEKEFKIKYPKLFKEIHRIDKFSEFDNILELRHMFKENGEMKSKSMLKKNKDVYDNINLTSSVLTDYVKYVNDYTKIKIVFVPQTAKQNKKHLKNYLLNSDITNIIMVKMYENDITDNIVKEFYDICRLSKSNVIDFTEVLKISEKSITEGKDTPTIVKPQPRTLRTQKLDGIKESPDMWYKVEVDTHKIKEELTGLYIPTINNKIQFRVESDKNAISNKYPVIMDIITSSTSLSIGLSKVIKLLLSCEGQLDTDLDIYSGHEKNFKSTKLIHIEDFLSTKIEEIYNLEEKTYNIKEIRLSKFNHFFTTIDFISKPVLEKIKIDKAYIEFKKYITKNFKNFKDMFYIKNHDILKLYNIYSKLDDNKDLRDSLINCNLIHNNDRRNDIEKILNIKFNILDEYDKYEKIQKKYNLNFLNSISTLDYCWLSADDLIQNFKDEMLYINQIDFIDKNAPYLENYIEKPKYKDIQQGVNTTEKHEEKLVAE